MQNSSRNHPPLKIPLVREALLELRFPRSNIPYGIVPGLLFEALKHKFPKPVELPISQIPQEIVPEHVVRHRFLNDSASRMFQVGIGVISVNHVAYQDFEDFLQDCKDVIEIAFREDLISKVSRIGLRYINQAPLDRSWNEIIQIDVNMPEIIQSNLQGQNLRLITGIAELGELATTITWPTFDESKSKLLTIDLDISNEPQNEMNPDDILDWVVSAHDIIYDVFRNSLQSEYFNYLQGD